MPDNVGAIAPVIRLSGALLENKWIEKLIHMRIDRGTCLVGRTTLRFSDNGFSLSASDTFALGKKVAISEPGAAVLFEGTVTGISLDQSARGLPELTVVIDDAAYALTRGGRTATYQQLSYAQVIEKIAGQHGLRTDIKSSSITMEYLLQAGTDLDFIDTLTQRLGYVWFVDEGPKLVAKPLAVGNASVQLTLKEDLTEFAVRATALRPTDLSVHGWDPSTQRVISDQAPPSHPGDVPALLRSYSGSGPKQKLSSATATVSELSPLTAAEAKQLAGAVFDDWAAGSVVARGTATITSTIKPGVTVQIKDAGPASGTYLVTSVQHIYDASGFVSKFECGPRRPTGLVDTLGAASNGAGFTIAGLVAGQVTDVVDPDNAGRVRVKFAGVDAGNVESAWARVVTIGGGNARGAVFLPEVNDEVLVGFEHGDARRPVVLGGLFSKRNALPTGPQFVDNNEVAYRRITSRKNHALEFADGAEPTMQHVLLQLGTKSHKLRLGADRFDIEVGEGVPLTIKAGSAKFDISQAGDITIEGNNITIKAKVALDLEGGTTAKLKGTAQTAVQGAQVQVKADGVGSVEAGGPLTIKGAIVGIN